MKELEKEGAGLITAKATLTLIIENQQFEWSEQYITGLQVKEKAGAPFDADLYLAIKEPWSDEAISNETIVNLARPGIEKFFFKNVYYFTLNDGKYHSFNAKLTGTELLKIAGITETRCYTLYQKLVECDFEKLGPEDIVDISMPGIERFITKEADTFVYTVDGEHEMTDKKLMTANEILQKASKDSLSHYLILNTPNGEIDFAWNPDEIITINCRGMEFQSRKWEGLISIEDYGKECKLVPPARGYQIKIDKQYHTINGRYISQETLIKLGGKPNVTYDVYKFLNKSPKPIKIALGENVDLLERCLVRFVLQPKEQTEGKGIRKEFILPAEDINTLDSLGLQWETIIIGSHWVIIYDYPIPKGYNVQKADLALIIPATYPITEIDMAYFFPALSKLNNRPIGAIANQLIEGRAFQRWSRHRQVGEWNPDIDCIATHLCLVDNWLIKDLTK